MWQGNKIANDINMDFMRSHTHTHTYAHRDIVRIHADIVFKLNIHSDTNPNLWIYLR